MRILILLIIKCLISSLLLNAQEENNPQPLYVIAPNGLKLREGPGTQYKVLETAPYKSTVLLTDEYFAQKDSTQQIKFPYAIGDDNNFIIHGSWLKIKYKNKNGYMLSTWLNPACTYESKALNENINQEFQLYQSVNQAHCGILPDPRTNNWYNLTVNPSGQFQMEKVQIEFLSTIGDMGYGILFDFVLRRPDNKKADVIIQSEKPLQEGKLFQKKPLSQNEINQPSNRGPEYYKLDSETQRKILLKSKNEVLKKVDLKEVYDSTKNETRIYYYKNGKEILMYTDNYSSIYGIKNVKLVADLDGDGILDYILEFDPDKASLEILFLSSEAENGYSHKAVASRASGYTC
jgi:hypothetical protein